MGHICHYAPKSRITAQRNVAFHGKKGWRTHIQWRQWENGVMIQSLLCAFEAVVRRDIIATGVASERACVP